MSLIFFSKVNTTINYQGKKSILTGRKKIKLTVCSAVNTNAFHELVFTPKPCGFDSIYSLPFYCSIDISGWHDNTFILGTLFWLACSFRFFSKSMQSLHKPNESWPPHLLPQDRLLLSLLFLPQYIFLIQEGHPL